VLLLPLYSEKGKSKKNISASKELRPCSVLLQWPTFCCRVNHANSDARRGLAVRWIRPASVASRQQGAECRRRRCRVRSHTVHVRAVTLHRSQNSRRIRTRLTRLFDTMAFNQVKQRISLEADHRSGPLYRPVSVVCIWVNKPVVRGRGSDQSDDPPNPARSAVKVHILSVGECSLEMPNFNFKMQNLVTWFSGKSSNLLTPDVPFLG